MGHKSKKSLIRQMQERLDDKLRIGQSKHNAKKEGTATGGVYSWGSYKSYLQVGCQFARWARDTHHCKSLEECRSYADEWLLSRSGLSAWTQKLDRAALAKIYGCTAAEFAPTPKGRRRADIRRSREQRKDNTHFSERNHADLVGFCRGSGLRRAELQALRAEDIEDRGDCIYIHVRRGSKGGRRRTVPVLPEHTDIVRKCQHDAQRRPDGHIFQSIPVHADIHKYRSEYATELYRRYARPPGQIPRYDRYICRRDLKGTIYDRQAMKIVSKALGHNRVNVIAGHYLRSTEIDGEDNT